MKTTETIFLGDSLTDFHDWKRFGEHHNAGIAGDTTDGLLYRLHYTLEKKPKTLILMIGTNDLLQRIPLQRIEKNYALILEQLGAVETLIILSLLPVTAVEPTRAINREVVELNSYLMAAAEKEGFTYVDLYRHFVDEKGGLQERYTIDGVHLTPEGYRLWESLLAPYLD